MRPSTILLALLPLVALEVAAAPAGDALQRRAGFGQGGFGRKGGFGQGAAAGQGAKGGAAAAKGAAAGKGGAGAAAAAAAASKSAAAAAASKSAAAAQGAAAGKGAAGGAAAAAAAAAAAKGKGGAANNAGAGAAAAGNATAAAAAAGGNPQTSLTLDPSVIAKGFANDGQDQPEAGQVPSLTSTNNFINFCVGQTITNGQQITTGSCNPAPLGQIPSTANIPSSKFVFPKNFDTSLKANTAFTVQMAVKNIQAGNFVNAQQNYYSAPQQVNKQGQIIGHTHVTIEQIQSLTQTTPNDPTKFAFFKGVNTPANAQGIVTADVTAGLPAGVYRMASINSAANHQPVLAPVAQHASLDDFVYFTVGN